MANLDTASVSSLLQVRKIRDLPAPPARVFAALTEPALLIRWWGPEGFECRWAELDIRPGGSFRIEMNRPETGYEGVFMGRYVEVVPPHRLVMEIHDHCNGAPEVFDASGLGPTRVSFSLDPLPGGRTRLTLLHEGFEEAAAAQAHEHGWEGSLSKLARFCLSGPKTPIAE